MGLVSMLFRGQQQVKRGSSPLGQVIAKGMKGYVITALRVIGA
jgi:hypothetical protein